MLVISMGTVQNTQARLCSIHKFNLILSLWTWERDEEKEEESSTLSPPESGMFWKVKGPWMLFKAQMSPSAACRDHSTVLSPHGDTLPAYL